ncbi:OmpA family protein [Pandoraea sp.]|uniref:OmpA family protein n=1 Tax=Pandoraea sp. TaxID=1883445 RepID=UPI0011F4CA02|nr:OmpA family protein [Pandoraea sp.]TAL57049.1 MAG: hypothetical protein EPN80_01275 [Pandoraea sp.]TAM18092.1 MAG: hypothetical protein EPN65_08370 [Pandoraea sp.]
MTRSASPAAAQPKLVRAYDYGSSIVLEFTAAPSSLSVTDASGAPVGLAREGSNFRLARKIYDFTIHTAAGARRIHLQRPAPVAASVPPASTAVAVGAAVAAAPAPAPAAANAASSARAPARASDNDVATLIEAAASQLAAARAVVEHGSPDERTLHALNRRLDHIQHVLEAASAAMLMAHFDAYQTAFRPSPAFSQLLVSAARSADRITLRGRTDSTIPGPLDPKIARQRALSVRQFLLDHGIASAKIQVFSLPAGDFIAPDTTPAGRALNRRVMIEVVNRRIAELARHDRLLAQRSAYRRR